MLFLKKNTESVLIWVLLGALGLGIVILAYTLDHIAKERVNTLFLEKVDSFNTVFTEKIINNKELLRGGKGFFESSNEVNEAEWKHYMETLRMTERFPAIQAFAFVSLSQGRKPQATVQYIEPENNITQTLLGQDFWQKHAYRKIMIDARDTGQPKIGSGLKVGHGEKVTTLFENSFSVFLPIFPTTLPVKTQVDRKKSIQGFIFGILSFEEIVEEIRRQTHQNLIIEIYDNGDISPAHLLYKSHNDEAVSAERRRFPEISKSHNFKFNNIIWTIRITTLPPFGQTISRSYPIIVLICGFALLLLAFITLWSLKNAKFYAEIIASERTAELQERTAFQNIIVENIPDLLVVMDADFRIVMANEAFLNIYPENRRKKIIGSTTFDLYTREEAQRFQKNNLLSLETGYAEAEESITLYNGDKRTFFTKKVRFENQAGEQFILGLSRDITDIKNTILALDQSEEQFRTVVEYSSVGTALVDMEGCLIRGNKTLSDILGYKQEELAGKDFQTITHPEDKDTGLLMRERLLKGELDNYRIEKRYYHKSGSVVWVLLSVALVNNPDGTPRHFIYQIQDITELKHAEEELMRSNTELERFAYIASHDLQEPLRMISNFTSLLSEEYEQDLDDNARQYMGFIKDASQRMQSLISDVLEYSRANSEDSGLIECNVQDQMDVVLHNLDDLIHETGAKITIPKLPTVKANPVRFVRLLQNLIGNAIKYRHKDRKPVVKMTVKERPKEWIFCIQDNGIGIKAEYLEQIFVLFKRLHNKDEYSGTGIGLAICKKIVESFGGKLWAESDYGKGSRFYFTIPKSD